MVFPKRMNITHNTTDLTDAEWGRLQSLLPNPRPGGRPRRHAPREILKPSSLGCARAALGACCHTSTRPGRRSTTTSACGAWTGRGSAKCALRGASACVPGAIPAQRGHHRQPVGQDDRRRRRARDDGAKKLAAASATSWSTPRDWCCGQGPCRGYRQPRGRQTLAGRPNAPITALAALLGGRGLPRGGAGGVGPGAAGLGPWE